MTAGTNDLDLRPGLTYKTIETRFCRFCSDAPGDIRHLSRADRNGLNGFSINGGQTEAPSDRW